MKAILSTLFATIMLMILISCSETVQDQGTDLKEEPSFKGVIAKTYEESVEAWPEKQRPPKDAPNVIIFLLDDVGFAQVESFG